MEPTVTELDEKPATGCAPAVTAGPPEDLIPEKWRVREDFVPKDRYLSAEFAQLEDERLWAHSWQAACRVEEIPEPGDFIEYRMGDQSILVVRVDDSNVKAYANACRHRGTRLASGCGRFGTAGIRCPFHGWRWDTNGTNTVRIAPGRVQRGRDVARESAPT